MAYIYVATALSSNGQKDVKIYLNDSTNKLHIIDDDANDILVPTANSDLSTMTATSSYATTKVANTFPDKWLLMSHGTYSVVVPAYVV